MDIRHIGTGQKPDTGIMGRGTEVRWGGYVGRGGEGTWLDSMVVSHQ